MKTLKDITDESDMHALHLIVTSSEPWEIRRNEVGSSVAITRGGYDILHLNPGTNRNERCVEAFVLLLNSQPNWREEFRKFRVAIRQALFECGVMTNPGSADSDLTTMIAELGKDKKALLENCVIMQSRVAAVLAVPEAVDALCAEDVFGRGYLQMLAEDDTALRTVIKAAGGQLADSTQEGDNR